MLQIHNKILQIAIKCDIINTQDIIRSGQSMATLNQIAKELGYTTSKSSYPGRKAVYKNDKFIENFTAYDFLQYLKSKGEFK